MSINNLCDYLRWDVCVYKSRGRFFFCLESFCDGMMRVLCRFIGGDVEKDMHSSSAIVTVAFVDALSRVPTWLVLVLLRVLSLLFRLLFLFWLLRRKKMKSVSLSVDWFTSLWMLNTTNCSFLRHKMTWSPKIKRQIPLVRSIGWGQQTEDRLTGLRAKESRPI